MLSVEIEVYERYQIHFEGRLNESFKEVVGLEMGFNG